MNTHKLLHPRYGHRANYAEIARYAARLDQSAEEILASVERVFGPAGEPLSMRPTHMPYAIYGKSLIESGALEQMNTAMRLPVAVSGALMPDAHPGYALPIGGVVGLKEAVSPSFVGYDIACRMGLTPLDISTSPTPSQLAWLVNDLRNATHFGMRPTGFDDRRIRESPVMDDPLWTVIPVLQNYRALAAQQLGSSGGGNHFADLMLCEVLDNPPDWIPLKTGERFIALLTHGGSRGTGHKLATHYIKMAEQEARRIAKDIPSGYEWLHIDTDAGREYLAVMALMGRYAKANHDLIHEHFMRNARIRPLFAGLENHHNYAWVEGNVVIHRKGATPAKKGQPGLIPGSSGSASYVVEGLGEPLSLYSSSHGAGRVSSRSQAKRDFDAGKVESQRLRIGATWVGVAQDENPYAYKDIDAVMCAQTALVRAVVRMTPLAVVMGGGSDDGD